MKTIERLLALAELLRGARPRSIGELAARFEVSERTLYRDISRLEVARLPVVREDAGYRLMDSLRPRSLPLTLDEHALLGAALENAAFARIPTIRPRVERLLAKLSPEAKEVPRVIDLAGPERSGPAGSEAIDALERAVVQRRAVRLKYTSLSSGATRWRKIDPWRILNRGGAWYLAGRCHDRDDLRFFRLDRARQVELTSQRFDPPEHGKIEDALSTAWSMFRSDQMWDIVIRFQPGVAPLIESARHHEGEQIEYLETGELEYRVSLSHLDEIARWVLGFGGNARAVLPDELRQRVVELAAGVLAEHKPRRGPKRSGRRRPSKRAGRTSS